MNTKLINKVKAYLATVPIKKAWIFGSFSREEEQADSDIDLLVEFVPQSRIGLQYFRIISDLEDLCNRKIDLVEAGMLDPRIIGNVDKDRILIYERAN